RRRRKSRPREHADVRGAGPVPDEAQGAVSRRAAPIDELPARIPTRHGHLRAPRIPRLARLGAVATDQEVARQQTQPAVVTKKKLSQRRNGRRGRQGRTLLNKNIKPFFPWRPLRLCESSSS